jgi:hypothetical protein
MSSCETPEASMIYDTWVGMVQVEKYLEVTSIVSSKRLRPTALHPFDFGSQKCRRDLRTTPTYVSKV